MAPAGEVAEEYGVLDRRGVIGAPQRAAKLTGDYNKYHSGYQLHDDDPMASSENRRPA